MPLLVRHVKRTIFRMSLLSGRSGRMSSTIFGINTILRSLIITRKSREIFFIDIRFSLLTLARNNELH